MAKAAKPKSRRRPKKTDPVSVETAKLKRLENFRKIQQLFNQQKLQQTIRDARANADALEGHLANMIPEYRSSMPDVQERFRRLAVQSFHSRNMPVNHFFEKFPLSYGRLREFIRPG